MRWRGDERRIMVVLAECMRWRGRGRRRLVLPTGCMRCRGVISRSAAWGKEIRAKTGSRCRKGRRRELALKRGGKKVGLGRFVSAWMALWWLEEQLLRTTIDGIDEECEL